MKPINIRLISKLRNSKLKSSKLRNNKLKSNKWKIIAASLLAVALLFTAACKSTSQPAGSVEKTVRVGSKNFTENLILAEIYSLALEDNGFTVDRKFDMADSVVQTAITNNDIDLYPEYTGTGLLEVLKHSLVTDPQQVYDIVKEGYEQQYNIEWLDYAPANDGQGLVITAAASEKYGIKTISDLQKNAQNIRFASQGEFDSRDDGLPALTAAYGPFNFKSSAVYDNSLKYDVLSSGQADLAPAYTTEGQLTDPQFVLLEDDKHVWPPYNIAPIVRQNVLDQYPEIADILNKIDKNLDTATMTALNAKVDVDKMEYEEVAKDYYDSIK